MKTCDTYLAINGKKHLDPPAAPVADRRPDRQSTLSTGVGGVHWIDELRRPIPGRIRRRTPAPQARRGHGPVNKKSKTAGAGSSLGRFAERAHTPL
jgi:hypothetical protein